MHVSLTWYNLGSGRDCISLAFCLKTFCEGWLIYFNISKMVGKKRKFQILCVKKAYLCVKPAKTDRVEAHH